MSIIFIILLFRSEKTAEKRADRGACGFIAASVLDVQEQEKRKRDNDMRRLSAVLLLGYQKRETTLAVSLFLVTGNVLPSQVVSNSVLSAQKGLTAVFGMGTGVSPSPLSPVSLNMFFAHSQLHSIFSLARHSLVM